MYKPYTNERFERLCSEIDAMAKGILEGKKLVYSPDEDRLEDFHFVAKVLGIRPAQVAAVYLLKHVQSVTVMVRNQDYRWYSDGGKEGIMEKVADIINLAKLLLACVDEELQMNATLTGEPGRNLIRGGAVRPEDLPGYSGKIEPDPSIPLVTTAGRK